MPEGDEPKPTMTPSSVPPDRAAALARKLTSGRPPAALARQSTGSSNTVTPRPIVGSEPPPPSKRDEVLAARRASIAPTPNDLSKPGALRPDSRPPPAKRTRKPFIALGALLVVAMLGGGGVIAKQMLYERSDEGRVHAQLLAWEFGPSGDPTARDGAFLEIDRMGPSGIAIAIDKLADESIAEKGASKSTRSVQMVAHLYLMHFASTIKTPPPKQATDIAKAVFEGSAIAQDRWLAARDAWRAWLVEQQSRGAVPK